MFWKCIRWGGTLAVLLLVVAAAYLGNQSATPATPDGPVVPAEPADAPPPNKNFNL
jgi:hypothetical protein